MIVTRSDRCVARTTASPSIFIYTRVQAQVTVTWGFLLYLIYIEQKRVADVQLPSKYTYPVMATGLLAHAGRREGLRHREHVQSIHPMCVQTMQVPVPAVQVPRHFWATIEPHHIKKRADIPSHTASDLLVMEAPWL